MQNITRHIALGLNRLFRSLRLWLMPALHGWLIFSLGLLAPIGMDALIINAPIPLQITGTPSGEPTTTPTTTPDATGTDTTTATPSVEPTLPITPTIDLTPIQTGTPGNTTTPTESPTTTETATVTATETPTETPTETGTPTETTTPTATPTSTSTPVPPGIGIIIDPSGGELTSEDGVLHVIFPAGAVTEAVTVYYELVAPFSETVDLSLNAAFELTAYSVAEPSRAVTEFQQSLAMTFDLTELVDFWRLPANKGWWIGYWDDELNLWLDASVTVDTTERLLVQTQSNHFSIWGVGSSTAGIVYLANRMQIGRSRNYYTTNSADVTWELITSTLPTIDPGAQLQGYTEFTLDPFAPTSRAWVSVRSSQSEGAGLWRTYNLNNTTPTWTKILSETRIIDETGGGGGSAYVQRVQASSVRPGLIFVLVWRTHNEKVWVGRSLNYGQTWSWTGLLDSYDRGNITTSNGLELSTIDANRLWVGSASEFLGGHPYVWESTDMGESFNDIIILPENFYAPSAIYVPDDPKLADEVLFVVNRDQNIYRVEKISGSWEYEDVTKSDISPTEILHNVVSGYSRDGQRVYYNRGLYDSCGSPSSQWWLAFSSTGGVDSSSWISRYYTIETAISGVWIWPNNPNRLLASRAWEEHHTCDPTSYPPVALQSINGGQTWVDRTGDWYTKTSGIYQGARGDASEVFFASIVDAQALLAALPITSALTTGCPCHVGNSGGAQRAIADPINTVTGGLEETFTDLTIQTSSGPLTFQRTYASTSTGIYTNTMGAGWTHNLDTRLIFDNTSDPNLVWFKAQGANQYAFEERLDGGYTPYPGVIASLVTMTVSGVTTYTLIGTDQSIYTFTAAGLLSNWQDPQSHVLNYTYDHGLLDRVTDPITTAAFPNGRYLDFEYDAQGFLISVSDHTSRTIRFGYFTEFQSGSTEMITMTDVLTQTWQYQYTKPSPLCSVCPNQLLARIIDPRAITVMTNTYDSLARVTAQYDALNQRTITLTYNTDGSTIMVNAKGITTTDVYDARGTLIDTLDVYSQTDSTMYGVNNFRPYSVTDELSHTTSLLWDSTGTNLTQASDAAGNTTRMGYDSLNNLTQTVDARGMTTTLAYTGTLPTAITDTLLNRTLYTYTAPPKNITDPPAGLLLATSDPNGATTQYQYDTLGQMVRMTDTTGIVTTYGYDALSRVVTTTTYVGTFRQNINVNLYNPAGWLTRTIHNYTSTVGANPALFNLTTNYGYDAVGNQKAITDTIGRVTTNTYDAANRLLQTVRNYTTTAGVDLTQYNLTTTYGYNELNLLVLVTDTVGRVTKTEYDALNRPMTVTANYTTAGGADPTQYNIKSVTEYDAAGNVISTTQFYGTALARTSYTQYDVLNRPVTVTTNLVGNGTFDHNYPDRNIKSVTYYDPNGNVTGTLQYLGTGLDRLTLTEYDPLNRPVTTTVNYSTTSRVDLNLQSVTGYDKTGNVLTTTAFANTSSPRLSLTGYDSANRPVTVTANYSTSTSAAGLDYNLQQYTIYSATTGLRTASVERRVTSVSGSLVTTLITTTYGYDVLGRLITTTWPLTNGVNATTVITYDQAGRVTDQQDPLGRVTHTDYDAQDRPITVTVNYVSGGPSDSETNLRTAYLYDALGNKLIVQDPKGILTRFQYDAVNRLTKVWENYTPACSSNYVDACITTVYTYDVASNLVNLTDGMTHTLTHTYDLLNRLVQSQDPLGYTTVYTYDVASNQVAMKDANGKVISTTYDFLNRPMKINYPDPDVDTDFAYDAFGQRTAMTDTTGLTTWGYDLLSRPLTITQPYTDAVLYGYDSASNRTHLKYPDSKAMTYTYDLASRLFIVKDWASRAITYSYNALGQLTQTDLPNTVTTYYFYDNANHVTTISHTIGLTTPGLRSAFLYAYDKAGNRTAAVEGIRQPGGSLQTTVITYTYDGMYRLTNAGYGGTNVFTYTYDAVGNRKTMKWNAGTTLTYTYDAANRLVNSGGITYTWDNNGNLTYDGTITYTYDFANRPITMTQGATNYTFKYNGFGDRRVQKVGNSTPTTYTVDINAGLTQVLADGTNTYLYGNGRILQQSSSTTSYFLGDALGSLRQLVSTVGAVNLAKTYQPYGTVLSTAGSGSSMYGFTGEQTDSGTDLVYLRARYYASGQGRFTTKDVWPGNYDRPLTLNKWNYSLSNPVNLVDPSGLIPEVTGYSVGLDASLTNPGLIDTAVVLRFDKGLCLEDLPGRTLLGSLELVVDLFHNQMAGFWVDGVTQSWLDVGSIDAGGHFTLLFGFDQQSSIDAYEGPVKVEGTLTGYLNNKLPFTRLKGKWVPIPTSIVRGWGWGISTSYSGPAIKSQDSPFFLTPEPDSLNSYQNDLGDYFLFGNPPSGIYGITLLSAEGSLGLALETFQPSLTIAQRVTNIYTYQTNNIDDVLSEALWWFLRKRIGLPIP